MTLPLLMSLADELDNLTTRSYLDDFGLGFYPHRHYHRSPSLQLSLPEQNIIETPSTTAAGAAGAATNSRQRFCCTGNDGFDRPSKLSDKYGFQIYLNVQQFKRNQLKIKSINNLIIIEGKRDENKDGDGEFIKRYELPKGYDPDKAISTITSDGILTVKIPSPEQSESRRFFQCSEKEIEILEEEIDDDEQKD